ncbi:MAG TPA: class I SAM-dependent methyltransferase [Longimicrobiaceae bacterium]|nr:class I SAM-dependent methyltransferase [Longimicrobiaceae bacterium]
MPDRDPTAIPTLETVAFCRRFLPPPPARVLEIGCGRGELAEVLQGVGYRVVAVDADPVSVEVARERGVDARRAHWPDFTDEPFAAVLFTRSLHHLHPLGAALEQARALIRPGGRVLVEDFAFQDASPATVLWLQGVLRLLRAADALLAPEEDDLAGRLLRGGDPYAAWEHDHLHEIHPVAAMESALAGLFAIEVAETAPYLYRYLVPLLPGDARGAAILRCVLDTERALSACGAIVPIGRRFVARMRAGTPV